MDWNNQNAHACMAQNHGLIKILMAQNYGTIDNTYKLIKGIT
jgi:hypothetical protein